MNNRKRLNALSDEVYRLYINELQESLDRSIELNKKLMCFRNRVLELTCCTDDDIYKATEYLENLILAEDKDKDREKDTDDSEHISSFSSSFPSSFVENRCVQMYIRERYRTPVTFFKES